MQTASKAPEEEEETERTKGCGWLWQALGRLNESSAIDVVTPMTDRNKRSNGVINYRRAVCTWIPVTQVSQRRGGEGGAVIMRSQP